MLAKQFLKESPGPLQPLLGEDDRLRLAARVGDVALLVQPVHRSPVEALPGPASAVQPQVKQGENRLIDLVRVEFHDSTHEEHNGANSRLSPPPPKRLCRLRD